MSKPIHSDHESYYNYTPKARLDKSINSLVGIVEGIAIDAAINDREVAYLTAWVFEHNDYRELHPFNELLPVVGKALTNGILSNEERLDILYLCEKLRSTEYYNATTADIQRLHAIMGGITSDGVITETELVRLKEWLNDHNHLRTIWPYDEIEGLITGVMADKRIDPGEHDRLLAFFGQFLDVGGQHSLTDQAITIQGICAVCPTIIFAKSLFCFTGASARYTRADLGGIVARLGGRMTENVSPKLNYLIIGAAGNPCWAYACYGRKVETAVNLRKQGHRLLLVHENDFHDAVVDAG